MLLRHILLFGTLLGGAIVLATRARREEEDLIEDAIEEQRLARPACPEHSFRDNGTSTKERRSFNFRRMWQDGTGEHCLCEEGYEAVRRDQLGQVVQVMDMLTLEFPGRPRQHWDGECREVQCYSSVTAPYKYLLFEGGGVRGVAYAGTVRALEEAGIIHHVEGFSGASAGSQVAALLAAGYRGEELVEVLVQLDFHSLMDEDYGFGLKILTGKFGYYKGEAMEQKINDLLKAKTGFDKTTFEELRAHGCKYGACKDFRLPALCVNTGRLTWFSAETTPYVSVARAVRASSSIPFFYQPPEIAMPDGTSCLFVDGGALRNLPHDAFALTPEAPALGLSLRNNGRQGVAAKKKFEGPVDYVYQLYEAICFGPDSANSIEALNKPVDIVGIDVQDVAVTDFDIGPMAKGHLLESGYRSAMMHMQKCKLGNSQPNMEPKWLHDAFNELLRDEWASRIKRGIDNVNFSPWWNSPDARDAFGRFFLYQGEVEKVGRGERSVEVMAFEDQMYIITHMPPGAGPQAHSLVHDIYLVSGRAVVKRKGHNPKDSRLDRFKKCLEMKVYNVKNLDYDFANRQWKLSKTPDNMHFCGTDEFISKACSKSHTCVDYGSEFYPHPQELHESVEQR
eukprot:gb/GFBE01046821.1/.p1 GENE.gb/GFBE01046821.1/~~gb/GFBE01046821.1/.p1  ORF type:complete len:622 (+),score=139.38 gb/GFBE01046821.1/:1-1866(+)